MSPRKAGATPHPKEQQILRLLAEGLTNAAIRRQLGCGEDPVRRIRAAAGIGPVPRSQWNRPPHPKADEIRTLLAEGYGNAEIGRRTGADVAAIARLRAAGGYGPATIRPTTTRWAGGHPKADKIRALLADCSNNEIARRLHADPAAIRRIRAQAGIEYVPPRFATPAEKWATLVRPVDGGHMEWLGERGASGTPVMRFREKSVSPAQIAFTERTGRPPVGAVRAECGYDGCVAPAHVDDDAARNKVRAQLRAVRGLPDPPDLCTRGHDRAEHGRYEADGAPYCAACKRELKYAARTTAEAGAR